MNIASMIDHTLLNADATKDSIIQLCSEAREYEFKAVCVHPYYVSLCKKHLDKSDVEVATVIGFPLGSNTKETKAYETKQAIENGATEVDMVINIGALKNKEYDVVLEDIESVVKAANNQALVKVIIETSLLTNDEKIKACELAMNAGANFVKTSTGFSTGGATVEDIKLMKSVVKDELGIKASGGVRDYETAKNMIDAGATRIGASAGIKIVQDS